MNMSTVVHVVMVAFISVTFLENLIRVIRESSTVKKEGKTPLLWQNITTVATMTGSQLLMTWVIVMLFSLTPLIDSYLLAGLMFVIMYYMSNIVAYISGYGLWTVFTKIEQRKMKAENPHPFTEGQ